MFLGVCVAAVTVTARITKTYKITNSLDTRLSYAPSAVFTFLKMLGKTGRHGYLYLHLVDYLYIVSYSILMGIVLVMLSKKLFPKNPGPLNICLIPFTAGLMDIFENISIDLLILSYPNHNMAVATLASFFTILKNIFLSISQLLIILGLLLVITSSFFQNKLSI